MKESVVYINGQFVPESNASISVDDLGLLRGYGIFDFMITYDREPFRLKDHLMRLQNSARVVGLRLPWTEKELTDLVYQTLQRNPEGERGIRILITGGESQDSFTPAEKPTLVIMAKPARVYPKEFFTEGIKVITFPGKREIPEAKTLNYLNAIKAIMKAKHERAEEALYTYDGVISECMACSFFAVKNNTIVTAEKGVLDGITRKTILELVDGKIPTEYRFIELSEIPILDEAFLTSSNHEIMPIVAIDQMIIGNGKPGPITKDVMRMFDERTGRTDKK